MTDKNDQPIFKMFTPVGKKIRGIVVGLFLVAGFLFVIDFGFLRQDCKPSQSQDKLTCVCSDIFTQFYASFFTAALSIWGVELALREETVKEIERIFKLAEAVKGIEAFYHDKDNYHKLLTDKIANLREGETIKILLLSEDIEILGLIGDAKFKDKIRRKCHFQILVIDPDSTLMACLDKVGSKDRQPGVKGQLSNFCQSFSPKFLASSTTGQAITGSLEIRLHKDVFSPVGYLSGAEINIAWMYLFDSEGSLQYPGFKISENNQELIRSAREHFDKLWSMSDHQEQIALRFDRSGEYVNRYRSDGENSSRT